MDEVIKTSQLAVNRITDKTREVDVSGALPLQIGIIARTDIVEYLTRRKMGLALCYFKRIYALGIESYLQLLRESRFPRSDETDQIVKLVMNSLPRIWQDAMVNLTVDVDTQFKDNFPISNDKGIKTSKLTVKMIKKRLRNLKELPIQHAYSSKLGINAYENVNPFLAARKANLSTSLFFFKYRLLHGDIYTKERMLKFKMVNNSNCDYCGQKEDVKHLLWECERTRWLWGKLQTIFLAVSHDCPINFDTLFVGFSPTNRVLESIITKATRIIITRERSNRILESKTKCELIEHCNLNIYCLLKKNKKIKDWVSVKNLLENQF